MKTVEILTVDSNDGYQSAASGYRPLVRKGGEFVANAQAVTGPSREPLALVANRRAGIVANSRLTVREWQMVDRRINTMIAEQLVAIADLRANGLVNSIPSIGIQEVTKQVQSKKRGASVQMDTQTRADNDRIDRRPIGIPVPVIVCGYSIGERELEASRLGTQALNVVEAVESAESVADKLEDIYFNGTTAIQFNGRGVTGILNTPGIINITLATLGVTGTWSTVDNCYLSVINAIAKFEEVQNRGSARFVIYLNAKDYAKLLRPRDNTDTTPLDMILKLPQVAGVKMSKKVTQGSMALVVLDSRVVELQSYQGIRNVEWANADQTTFYGKVIAVEIPWVQQDYDGNVGVMVVTGL